MIGEPPITFTPSRQQIITMPVHRRDLKPGMVFVAKDPYYRVWLTLSVEHRGNTVRVMYYVISVDDRNPSKNVDIYVDSFVGYADAFAWDDSYVFYKP